MVNETTDDEEIDDKEVIVAQHNEHQPLRFPRSERPMLATVTKSNESDRQR